MGRPAKAVDVMTESGSSHLTKGEIKARKDAEKASLSGVTLRERAEVRVNPIAHAEFLRVTRLLDKVGRRDALFEPIINRYCMIQAECAAYEAMRAGFDADLEALREDVQLDSTEKCRLKAKMQDAILAADKQLQQKRKMLFDIERECGMTVSSAVRIVPKVAPQQSNPLLEALSEEPQQTVPQQEAAGGG